MPRWSLLLALVLPSAHAQPETTPPEAYGAGRGAASARSALPVAPAANPAQAGNAPPRGLACLTKYYVGSAVELDGGWALELPDATRLPWGSGPAQTSDAGEPGALEVGDDEEPAEPQLPMLQDIFATAYLQGPIVPVAGDDTLEDPGRARIDALFKATYGSTWRQVMGQLAKVKFFGTRYPFHERAAPALERVVERLERAAKEDPKLLPFFKGLGGTWHWRRIARSRALSTHAFGIAIDLNVERSNYWRWQRPKKPLKWTNRYPQAIVDAFEAEGFIWGGRWIHYDTMHFEYRPELLDVECRD